MARVTMLNVTDQEFDTILAALRFYQDKGMSEPANRPDWLQELACPTDNCTSLDNTGIDNLCESIKDQHNGG